MKKVMEIRSTSMDAHDPIVEEVLRFEELPPGSLGSRRAIVRWSDGTEGEAIKFFADLCGCPHKSPYSERPFMLSDCAVGRRRAEFGSSGSA
jgi:hypothetical protein